MRNFKTLAAVLCVAALPAIYGCGDDDNNNAPAPEQPGTIGVTVTIEPNAMNRGSDAYGANPLVVQKGTVVTWRNNDTMIHTVTSSGQGSVLNSGDIAPEVSFSYPFTDVGTYDYLCENHPTMTGSVEVIDGPVPSPSPSVSPTPSPTPSPLPTVSPSATR